MIIKPNHMKNIH